MEDCTQRGVAAAALGAGAVVGAGGGFQCNGCSPSSPGNQWLCHPASWWSCSGEEGGRRVGSEAGTVVVGRSAATEKEEWTETCP